MAAGFKFAGMADTAGYIAAAGFPFPLALAWLAAIFEVALVLAFLTGAWFAEAALVAAAYVLFLAFAFHGPARWEGNQVEFGFFVDHFSFIAGLLFAAAHGPGRWAVQRRDRLTAVAESLERFVAAQDPVWPRGDGGARRRRQAQPLDVVRLSADRRARHQRDVGRYALASVAEARGYLAHPVLGPRLREATDLMLGHAGRPAEAVLGGIDAVKFRSSMTLFEAADPGEPRFRRALEAFFGGKADPRTLALLGD